MERPIIKPPMVIDYTLVETLNGIKTLYMRNSEYGVPLYNPKAMIFQFVSREDYAELLHYYYNTIQKREKKQEELQNG